jgi:hypothetical protein
VFRPRSTAQESVMHQVCPLQTEQTSKHCVCTYLHNVDMTRIEKMKIQDRLACSKTCPTDAFHEGQRRQADTLKGSY